MTAPFPLLLPHLDSAPHTGHSPKSPITISPREQAWQRLISNAVAQDELPSLIDTIFLDKKITDIVDYLQESDAQAFVDVIDGVRHRVLPFSGICRYFSFTPLPLLVRHWIASTSH